MPMEELQINAKDNGLTNIIHLAGPLEIELLKAAIMMDKLDPADSSKKPVVLLDCTGSLMQNGKTVISTLIFIHSSSLILIICSPGNVFSPPQYRLDPTARGSV